MNNFEKATLRLKQELGVAQDKEVAVLMGMSPRAWAGRKERDAFPDMELLSLMRKRPELNIDFDYVTTGIPAAQFEADNQKNTVARRAAGAEEDRLLSYFRQLSDDSQKAVVDMTQRLAVLETAQTKRG